MPFTILHLVIIYFKVYYSLLYRYIYDYLIHLFPHVAINFAPPSVCDYYNHDLLHRIHPALSLLHSLSKSQPPIQRININSKRGSREGKSDAKCALLYHKHKITRNNNSKYESSKATKKNTVKRIPHAYLKRQLFSSPVAPSPFSFLFFSALFFSGIGCTSSLPYSLLQVDMHLR